MSALLEKTSFRAIHSAKPKEQLSFGRSARIVGKVTPTISPPNPREALKDTTLQSPVRKIFEEKFDELRVRIEDVRVEDHYGGDFQRKFTTVRDSGIELTLLQIPSWILGDGNYVGSLDEIRYAFRGKCVRLISEDLDAPWLGLEKLLNDWKVREKIDGKFVPWRYIRELQEGKLKLADVLSFDLSYTRRSEPMKPTAIEVFFSYAHEDETHREELIKHLSILKHQGIIQDWHDRNISGGDEWKNKIDEHLESAGIILLLISSDFLASDYCYDVELRRAMERHESRSARVIPVILRSVDWKGAPFGKLQALPKDANPVTSWSNLDEAFTNVAEGIRNTIEELKTNR